MSDNTELNPGYGGDIYAADDVGGIKYQRVKLVHGADGVNDGDVATGNGLPVAPANVSTEFRESFETYDTTNVWSQSVGSGDIVQIDGNAASASYLVISKDPLTADNETIVETRVAFTGPFETSVGLSMSQRVLGQETSIELVSTDTPLSPVADLAISSMGSNTTTLYINTVNPHNLSVGQRFGIYGITSDSRMNYPSLVVSAIISSTQIYATAGPGGTIPSLTVGPYNNQGFLYVRPALGYAQEGLSEIFENASATAASCYVRSDAGDALPTGTVAGAHGITVGTTAPVALASASYTYAFIPTTDYRFLLQADKAQFFDVAVDSTAQPSARANRSSVVPSLAKTYKLRFRCTNNKGLTVPTAKIVSQSKAGSTTATVTTATAHGLTTGDYVVLFGTRDVTNFQQTGGAVQVLSTPTSTTFTVAYTTSVTATSYGGFVARVQGGNIPAGFGTPALVAAQTAFTAGLSNELQMTGSGNWSVSIGDYVNVYGLRDATAGGDMGVDGVYRVVDIATTTIRLAPIGGATLPSFTSTNVGGTIIKRTDTRISYARIFQYLRERVEVLNKSDQNSSLPVVITNTGYSVAVTTASLASNLISNDITSAAITSTATSAAITPAAQSLSQEFNVIVTATSGTGQTLDVVVQESDDSGTNWYDVYHFPRITAVGQYRSPLIPLTGNRVRYVRTVAGTTPSFTMSLNRIQSQTSNAVQRQFFDRALVINTLNSVTPSYFVEGCADLNVLVSMGAVTTTAPVLALEVSPDNATWVQVGADITTAASTNNLLQVTGALGRFARIRVKTAGSGATLGFLMVKGIGR